MLEVSPELFPEFIKLGIFWLAIALLVGVSGGVAYLTWVDRRDVKLQKLDNNPAPKSKPPKTKVSQQAKSQRLGNGKK